MRSMCLVVFGWRTLWQCQLSGKADPKPSLCLAGDQISLLCAVPLWWVTTVSLCLAAKEFCFTPSILGHVAERPSDWAWPQRAFDWGRGDLHVHKRMAFWPIFAEWQRARWLGPFTITLQGTWNSVLVVWWNYAEAIHASKPITVLRSLNQKSRSK